jgi:hypothetical protein
MTLELAIISIIAGAVLGLRYNALVLLPAITFAMLFALIAGVLRADGVRSIVFMMTLLSVAVQLGYLAGAAISTVVESLYIARRRGLKQLSTSSRSAWPRTWQAPIWQLTPSTVANPCQRHPPHA